MDLVGYYEKHPLYRKMRLRYPINEDTLDRMGTAVGPPWSRRGSGANRDRPLNLPLSQPPFDPLRSWTTAPCTRSALLISTWRPTRCPRLG